MKAFLHPNRFDIFTQHCFYTTKTQSGHAGLKVVALQNDR